MIILISIVTYNNSDKIGGLLEDLILANDYSKKYQIDLKIRIFDNSSKDNTVKIIKEYGFKQSLTISNINLGFGIGHNKNILNEESDIALIVNPDIRFKPDILMKIILKLKQDNIGMILPKLYFPDGRIQKLCKRNPTVFDIFLRRFTPSIIKKRFEKRMKRYIMADHDYIKSFEVEYASGAFMIVRTRVYKEVGGFDPRYFLYIEDADLTRSIREAGYKIIYDPEITVEHYWNKGSYKSLKLAVINIISVLKYLYKWDIEKRFFKQ